MGLFSLFFPENSRHFFGKRWLNVLLRSLHLCSASGYAGGFLFDVPSEQLRLLYVITAITGLVMIFLDVFSNAVWLLQNRGWMIILKVLLLGQLALIDPFQKWGIFAIIL
ncbi:MAG: hypothetical protein HQ517_10835, partial [SAR324 cluster bacterium]|nr:hypothetical protein [SAR324 cluster bacterium]